MSEATKYSPSPRPTTIGRAVADGDDRAGIVMRDHDEREEAAQAGERPRTAASQPVVAELEADEVGDHLRVGLGDGR